MTSGLIGALVGGALGYAYYRFIGCRTGECPLWANPISSVIYGVALGLLFGWR